MKKITILITALFAFTVLFSGCTTISETSENYSTHSLKYLVNNTQTTEDSETMINDLTNLLKKRLNKFEVANVEINHEAKDNLDYITVDFGTIDDVNDIKKWLELDSTFSIKKKIIDESDFETIVTNKAKETLQSVISDPDNFETIAQNKSMDDPERIFYSRSTWMYKNEIKDVFIEPLFNLEPNKLHSEVIFYTESPFALAKPITIGTIVKLFDKRNQDRVDKQAKEVKVSHILIAYEGALRTGEEVTRSKDEALLVANEIITKLENNQSFESLALEFSDDASNKGNGGELEVPVGYGTYVTEFEEAVLNELNEVVQITEPFETPFGYHIVKAREITEASEEIITEEQVQFGVIFFAQKPKEWEVTEMSGDYLVAANILFNEEYKPFIEIVLNQDGRDLLHTLTEENDKEILGVFIGNELVTSFTVKEINGSGIITIKTTTDTLNADKLKEKFDLKPLPAPIVFIEDTADKNQEPAEESEQE